MPRHRLGVVLLVAPPLGDAVDGLRRAFGDPALDRVAPHITLVPPVNVRDADMAAVLSRLRQVGGRTRPLELAIGPVAVFPGHEHVAYLEVHGTPAAEAALVELQGRVTRAPLDRPADHDFVPHVTLTQGVDADRLAAVVAASADWTPQPLPVERLHLLEEQHQPGGRRWVPIADVALAPPVIVGRGGLELELTPGELLDPEARAAAFGPPARAGTDPAPGDAASADPAQAAAGAADEGEPDRPAGARRLVVVARQEGRVVGVQLGWTQGEVVEVTGGWIDPTARAHGVEDHLAAAFASAAADRTG